MSLTIELSGVGAVNFGAELMLLSAIDRLRGRYPGSRLVVSYRVPAAYRRKHGLFATRPADRVPGFVAAGFSIMPEIVGSIVGLLPRSAIDVTLDLSGFAYGDDWPLAKMKNRLGLPALKETQPVILMPQAFGPFSKPDQAAMMREILDTGLLTFARDEVSFKHMLALDPAYPERIHLAPDFTNLLTPEGVSLPADDAGLGLIVPNSKVIEYGGDAEGYVRFLRRAADRLSAAGMAVSLLIHETASDRPIAEAVSAREDAPIDIVEPANALEAKRLLAGARCVVSSRFHALVGALSCGVPALACGWSHKYGELLRDYAVPDMMVDLAEERAWDDRIDALLELAGRTDNPLNDAADAQKERSEAMWELVFEEIGRAHSSLPNA